MRLIECAKLCAAIAVCGYLALVGATVSLQWIEGLAMGVTP